MQYRTVDSRNQIKYLNIFLALPLLCRLPLCQYLDVLSASWNLGGRMERGKRPRTGDIERTNYDQHIFPGARSLTWKSKSDALANPTTSNSRHNRSCQGTRVHTRWLPFRTGKFDSDPPGISMACCCCSTKLCAPCLSRACSERLLDVANRNSNQVSAHGCSAIIGRGVHRTVTWVGRTSTTCVFDHWTDTRQVWVCPVSDISEYALMPTPFSLGRNLCSILLIANNLPMRIMHSDRSCVRR